MPFALQPDTPVGGIATSLPSSISVFERVGIDYCCGGERSVADAATAADVDLDALLAELSGLVKQDQQADWSEAPLGELLDYILERHHTYTKEAIATLRPLSEKVHRVHGEKHPHLGSLRNIVRILLDELEMHLKKEEEILFPMIRAIGASEGTPAGLPPCGPIAPMQIMEHEHEAAGVALRDMRALTNEYTLPSDACTSYTALYKGLEDLEQDLHRHIHLENNVLHPRTRALVDAS